MVTQGRTLLAAVATAALSWALPVAPALAHNIDYIAEDIQPEAEFTGNSGHFKVKNPVAPGASITFMLTLELIESRGGPTATLPATVNFSVQNMGGPESFSVTFGAANTPTASYTYQKVNGAITPFTTQVTAIAPSTPGPYHFKVRADDVLAGKGLQAGEGIVIHFRVSEPTPVCSPVATELTLAASPDCLIYRAPSTTFTATLMAGATPLAGKTITFSVDGASLPSGTTGADGKATIPYDPSALSVGNHTVAAQYTPDASDACAYLPDGGSTTLGVNYQFQGFQPPVKIDGIGAGLFSGKVIPVKIKIADYYGVSVSTAEPRVFFSQTTQDIVWEEAEPIQQVYADTGNLMRYDPTAQQYVFNWNVTNVSNGSYNVRVGLNESECATAHWAPVAIQKSGKK